MSQIEKRMLRLTVNNVILENVVSFIQYQNGSSIICSSCELRLLRTF